MASFLRPTALKLRNFKGIAELDMTLDESLTLLAGVNGVGKTSVLQALLAAVTRAWGATPHHNYPFFRFSESVTRAGTTGAEVLLELVVPDQSPIALRLAVQEVEPETPADTTRATGSRRTAISRPRPNPARNASDSAHRAASPATVRRRRTR